MKKIIVASLAALGAHNAALAADTAGIIGIMNTSGTVEVNNFISPRHIWTVYNVDDPAEQAVLLAYIGYRRVGRHQISIEWLDQAGKKIDSCVFDPVSVPSLPWIHTITCEWGGRLPDGGITFHVYNTHGGRKERIGEMFLPPNK